MNFANNLEKLNKAVSLINQSNYIVILTGAGISTPSGVPDFRSQDSGLWIKNNPIEVASLSGFRSNPSIFYDWFHPLMETIMNASPNPAHFAIANLERKGLIKVVITQNIDLFHQEAGSINVLELHGSIKKFSCLKCGFETNYESHLIKNYLRSKTIPNCSRCNTALKPSIIFYEEMLPIMVWEEANFHSQKADLFIVVGTSLEVYPANLLPEVAIRNNSKLIINTLSSTQMDSVADVILNLDVVEVWNYINERIDQKINLK
jgi:NAD-dependent deacetylase